MKRKITAAAATAALFVTLSAGPAAAWNPFTEPPRTFWCQVWPSFCR